MTAINQDFSMHAGDTKVISLTVKDANGSVVNLTGLLKAQFVVKNYANSTTELVTKTLGSGITNGSPSLGILEITIDATSSASLNAGEYYHETRIKDTDSNIGTVTTGTLTVKSATTLS